MLANETIETFKKFINFDIESYFNDFINFNESELIKLESFYLGKSETKDTKAQTELNRLLKLGIELDTLCQQKLHNFERGDYVNLMEYIDEVFYTLKKINLLSVFLRSVLTEKMQSSTIVSDRFVRNYETPEKVVEKEQNDWMDSWVDIYIKNRKLETDYKVNEGYYIQLNKSIFTNFNLNSVIDNLIGENLYGKDIRKNIDIENNDFITLNGKETLLQSVEILSNLKRGDIPQYPNIGIDETLLKGNFEINFPLIVRSKQKDFSIDDTLLGFSITDIQKQNGQLKITFEVQSFYSTIVNEEVVL